MITSRPFASRVPWRAASPPWLPGCWQAPAADRQETLGERTGRGPVLPRSLRRPDEAVLV